MRPSQSLRCAALAFALGTSMLASSLPALAGAAPVTPTAVATEVQVERVRPGREKHPTLRFLKANRDFIRARLDLLREKPGDALAGAEAIDPRFLAYRELMTAALAGADSVQASEDMRSRRTLFASVTELGQLESQLDQLERLLAAQRQRLTALQDDFTGHQRTALAIVARGYPADATLLTVGFALEDGGQVTITLTDAQRAALREGGALELFHGLVEPRDQVVAVSLAGSQWPAGETGFVSLAPPRDRLTFLQLDFSALRAERGAASLSASTWLLDATAPISDGAGAQP